MKKLVSYVFFTVYVSVCFGSLADVPQTADGQLTDGEYATLSVTLENSEELFVKGGGAFRISAEDNSYLEVQYTSTPKDDNWNTGGITDIMLYDNSELLYWDGITQEITVRDDAKAHLKGGRVDYITLYRRPQDSSQATIYCRDGWSWLYDGSDISGITGQWGNGIGFDIDFINVSDPFPPTSDYINVEIVPEPATLSLFAFGGFLIRRKK